MWTLLFSPQGRISRSDIWLKYFLPMVGVLIAAFLLGAVGAGMAAGAAKDMDFPDARHMPTVSMLALFLPVALALLFFAWPYVAVRIKRFHDLGLSGWWVVWTALLYTLFFSLTLLAAAAAGTSDPPDAAMTAWCMLGLLGGFVIEIGSAIVLFLLPGQRGDNGFGPDPLRAHARSGQQSSA